MESFARLCHQLEDCESAQKTTLSRWLERADEADAAWAIWLLSGRRFKRVAEVGELRDWARKHSELPDWLWAECEVEAGDLVEAIALTCSGARGDLTLSEWMRSHWPLLTRLTGEERARVLSETCSGLSRESVRLIGAWLLGKWRVPVEPRALAEALAEISGRQSSWIQTRLLEAEPKISFYRDLMDSDFEESSKASAVYAFSSMEELSSESDVNPALSSMGEAPVSEWVPNGIRAQILRRSEEVLVWSENGEWISGPPKKLKDILETLPSGFVLEAWVGDIDRDWRISDCLEWEGSDLRGRAFFERREVLESWFATKGIPLTETFLNNDEKSIRALRTKRRSENSDGLRIRSRTSLYGEREFFWKADLLTVDAVLLYANSGAEEYTFALRRGQQLLPLARVSGDEVALSEEEIEELERWIRKNTREKFGPVRSVEPVQIFEIGFEAIEKSSRHKAGFQLRSPQVLRWKKGQDRSRMTSWEEISGNGVSLKV